MCKHYNVHYLCGSFNSMKTKRRERNGSYILEIRDLQKKELNALKNRYMIKKNIHTENVLENSNDQAFDYMIQHDT